MSESSIRDKIKFSAKTEGIRPSMYYDVQSELILYDNALC